MRAWSVNNYADYDASPSEYEIERAKQEARRQAEIDGLGGFSLPPMDESTIPLMCTYCDGFLSRAYAEKHRERCAA